mmetsp:Transcript_8861/g.21648  ORF Transcript_8861/g.21648 Transcript_8861/m.21648 type:complete len:620 (-) Transcript_8861:336-2195(-)
MALTNDDWETLRAIYDDGGHDYCFDDTQENSETNSERKMKLVSSSFPNGFCGTVYMTLSTSKIAFARLVRSDGSYRYFTLSMPPILKLDLLYFSRKRSANPDQSIQSKDDDDDHDDVSDVENEGPSNLRLLWEYYPSEWPTIDKEKYRSSLARKCQLILREEGSFSVCQFLEHDAISFYYKEFLAHATTTLGGRVNESTVNASNSWKTYADPYHPDYLLVILPPKMDQLYYSSIGTLLHPREEAAKLKKIAAERKAAAKTCLKKNGKKKRNTSSKTPVVRIENTLDFGRHALLQNWKDLYMTRCPICLEESMLYSDGVVLPYCQHYCCRDCFDMYLKFKVQDIKQHRTNPFVCPIESCKRELPMGFCKQFLSDEDGETAKAWYKDLKNPPAWSLDRCLRTKTCGAIGSMRRKKGVISIDGATPQKTNTKNSAQLSPTSKLLDNLVYCESCQVTWCELCLTRVYDDFQCKPVPAKKQLSTKERARENHTISKHRFHCKPQPILRFCRRYMATSKEIQETCENKYPWIASYSQFCQHDGAALQYILENGQRCPNCSAGVERTEGCFHMKCPTCATHFCYECGTELFPPYYGTHHCWEETADEEDNGQEVDEQLAMALQYMD